jgi:hypothetical protein
MMVDSFNIDDISLSNQFPFTSNEDVVEVNRTPIAKKRWARSANYFVEEDEALVVAWENVSLDLVIGRDQSTKAYWMRIADHFHKNVKKPSKPINHFTQPSLEYNARVLQPLGWLYCER